MDKQQQKAGLIELAFSSLVKASSEIRAEYAAAGIAIPVWIDGKIEHIVPTIDAVEAVSPAPGNAETVRNS